MKIYIGADHRGFKLKNKLTGWLVDWEYEVKDLGAYSLDPKDDYTLYAQKVGSLVASDSHSLGVLLCGSGVGVDIAANKIDGVRASMGKSAAQVKAGRNDDNMNILVIAADFTSDQEAKNMLEIFLKTKFANKAKHKRRLEEIERLEENN